MDMSWRLYKKCFAWNLAKIGEALQLQEQEKKACIRSGTTESQVALQQVWQQLEQTVENKYIKIRKLVKALAMKEKRRF